jgi:DNA polymerase-1
MTHIDALIGPRGKNQITMAEVPVEAAAPYAAADAETVLRLRPILLEELKGVGEVSLLEDIEMPLVRVLAEMELAGVLLDREFFAGMSVELGKRMAELESQVYEMVGGPFNINSTQQLSDVLFKRLGLQPPDRGRKTASGHYSTSADVLELLRGQHPAVDLVLEHRELSKLKSTYVDALPAAADSGGRVHTSYGQAGAITGRLSSSNPNCISPPAPSWAAGCATGSSPPRTTPCCRWITRKSSCASWPTWQRMRPCCRPSATGRTSTPQRPPPSTTSRSRRCSRNSAATPRQSISG